MVTSRVTWSRVTSRVTPRAAPQVGLPVTARLLVVVPFVVLVGGTALAQSTPARTRRPTQRSITVPPRAGRVVDTSAGVPDAPAVAMPDLRDSTVTAALARLRTTGFTNVRVDSARAASPEVIWVVSAQAPNAGDLLPSGAMVLLTAVARARPRAPYLLKLTEDQARAEAEAAGFRLRVERHERALRIAGVLVKTQQPAPFVLASQGATVAVVMSDPLPPLATAGFGAIVLVAASAGARRVARIRPHIRVHMPTSTPTLHGVSADGPVKTDLAISAELGAVVTEIIDDDVDLVAKHVITNTGARHE